MKVLTARRIPADVITLRMSAAEKKSHAGLIENHGFDITQLAVNGSSPFNLGEERFMLHFVEAPYSTKEQPGWPMGLPIAINVLDLNRKDHVGFLHFAVQGEIAVSQTAIRDTCFTVKCFGDPLETFLERIGLSGMETFTTEEDGIYQKLPALLVDHAYRGRNFSVFLSAIAGFLANRVYGAQRFQALVNWRNDAWNIFEHLAEKAFTEGIVKIAEPSADEIENYEAAEQFFSSIPPDPEPLVTFNYPLNKINNFLGYLTIKPMSTPNQAS
jgi:hypothetical protein